MNTMTWTPAFSDAAVAEGWDLFDLDTFQHDIEAGDDQREQPGGVADDAAAIKLVTKRAADGAAHAIVALTLHSRAKCSACNGLLPDHRYIDREGEPRPTIGEPCICA